MLNTIERAVQRGEIVAERFEIEKLAGTGGMGVVYRAKDRVTGGTVGLKVLHGGEDGEAIRFAREARALSALNHPAIVRYVAHGVTRAGRPYLAMEWVEGESLSSRMVRAKLTAFEAISAARSLAGALAAAHARGIVHRDVKPANIVLEGGDASRAKLLDFGLVSFAHSMQFTGIGDILGTPSYMAPEQARAAERVDGRADIYSLGCVLFAALAGRPPFGGDNLVAILSKVIFEEPPSILHVRPDVPSAFDALMHRMMAKEPEGRPRSATDLASEIDAIAAVDLDATMHDRPMREAEGLTSRELSLVSVVLSAPGKHVQLEPWAARLRAEFGVRVEQLASGTLVAAVASRGAATDQAAHAARFALALRTELGGAPLALATGRGLMHDDMPVGEAIDRAASLAARLEGSSILLDDVTAGLLDGHFEIDVSGGSAKLVSARLAAEAARTLLGRKSPFVGRERELRALEDAFDEATSEPFARAAVVTGAPGVGKSRLRHEFVARVQSRGEVELWAARGDPMSAGSPFGLLRELVRRATNVLEGESATRQREKITARVAQVIEGEKTARVAAFLCELLAVPLDDEVPVELVAARQDARVMGEQIRRAWDDLVTAQCARAPLVIVLEDIHWGDLPSMRLLDFALEKLEESPLFVLAFARPEVSDVFPALWASRRKIELRLDPLSRKASEKLVRAMLGEEMETALLERLVERASGNAFFLEELIRSAAAGRSEGLPETVLAMVHARIDALEAPARRVLRAASVFGQTFWGAGVEALVGHDTSARTSEWLSVLVARELVVRRSDARFHREHELAFRHALVREAAYASLTEEDRTLGHRLAGEWLEAHAERDALTLAEHFERGGARTAAVKHYIAAADQALAGGDLVAALARTVRGIACGPTEQELSLLRGISAEAQLWRGNLVDAERDALAAIEKLPRGGALWCRLVGGAIALASDLGHVGEAISLIRSVIMLPPSDEEASAYHARAYCLVARTLIYTAQLDLARTVLARLDAMEARVAGRDLLAEGWILRARFYWAITVDADPGEALRLARQSEDCFKRAADSRSILYAQFGAGLALVNLGAYEEAARTLRGVMEQSEKRGVDYLAALCCGGLSMALAQLGHLDEARVIVERSVTELSKRENKGMLGYAYHRRAVIHRLRGDFDAALQDARRASSQLLATPNTHAIALSLLARLELAHGRIENALANAREAESLLQVLGGQAEASGVVSAALAEVLEAAGEGEQMKAVVSRGCARLLKRVARIEPPLREAYLHAVPEHAKLLAFAAKLGLEQV